MSIAAFISLFAQGKHSDALAALFTHPGFQLDALDTQNDTRALLHYAHALAYGHQLDALITGRHLYNTLQAPLSQNEAFVSALRETLTLHQITCLEGEILHRYLQQGEYPGAAGKRAWIRDEGLLEAVLDEKNGQASSDFAQACKHFQDAHRPLYAYLKDTITYFSRPCFALQFPDPGTVLPIEEDNAYSPALLMAPLSLDWEATSQQVEGHTALLVFSCEATLFQCLQFPALERLINSRQHVLYFPQLYPNPQIAKQPVLRKLKAPLKPILLPGTEGVSAAYQELVEAFSGYAAAPRNAFREDNPQADALYVLGREFHRQRRFEQLGPSHLWTLRACQHNLDWADGHKGAIRLSTGYQAAWDQHFLESLQQHPRAARRKAPATRPLKLAHITPQLVDGGHSPSKLLCSLLQQHDRSLFKPYVFVTERLFLRACEYPLNAFASPPSSQRGPQCLQRLKELDVPVFIDDCQLSLSQTAERLELHLDELGIDVAVFHGPDEINSLCAWRSGVSLKAFFEHGTLPSQPGFDLIFSSTDDAAEAQQAKYAAMDAQIVGMPFVLDARQSWTEPAPTSQTLGLPQDAFVFTTISNHLEARLGREMIDAIAQILRCCPKAHYAPMGPVKHPERLMEAFAQQGIVERVHLLGTQERPSQVARAMHVYLNEFPFGSCISMLEAMAAGCPPVSMYDANGPTQARYGGDYFGKDYAVCSLDPVDYINLSCRLYEDASLYESWSERAVRLYNARTDQNAYCQRIEHCILDALQRKAAQTECEKA
jgi:glycosyltransferase involved in cell wall biosynthesis